MECQEHIKGTLGEPGQHAQREDRIEVAKSEGNLRFPGFDQVGLGKGRECSEVGLEVGGGPGVEAGIGRTELIRVLLVVLVAQVGVGEEPGNY